MSRVINIFFYYKIYTKFFISLLLSFFFCILPLPKTLELFKPDLVILVLLYWVISVPGFFGFACAWGVGILLDVLFFMPLGSHVFGLIVITFMAHKYHRRFLISPLLQQSAYVVIYLIIYKLFFVIFSLYARQEVNEFKIVLSLISDFIIWTWVKMTLDAWMHKLKTNNA